MTISLGIGQLNSAPPRRDGTMARLLMAIVVVFLCCHSTKIIVNFYEAVQVILRPNVGNDDDDDDDDDCGQYSVTSGNQPVPGCWSQVIDKLRKFSKLVTLFSGCYFPTTHSQGRGWSKGGHYYMIYDDLESDREL